MNNHTFIEKYFLHILVYMVSIISLIVCYLLFFLFGAWWYFVLFENDCWNLFYNSIVRSPVLIFYFSTPFLPLCDTQRNSFAYSMYHRRLGISLALNK